jgi:hypothetical protein
MRFCPKIREFLFFCLRRVRKGSPLMPLARIYLRRAPFGQLTASSSIRSVGFAELAVITTD